MRNDKKSGPPIYIIVPAIVGVLCVVAITAALVLGLPAKVKAARIGKQLDLGNKYLASADYDNAEVTFNKVLKIDPKSVEAATGMAKVYNEKQEPERALEYLEMASDNLLNPSQAEELLGVVDDTKTQMKNAQTNEKQNKKSMKKIEKIIEDVMPTPTPTPEVEEKPTPTEGAPDIDDDDIKNGTNSSDPTDEEVLTPTIPPADGIIPLPEEDILTPIPKDPTPDPDTNDKNAFNAGDTGSDDTVDNDGDDSDDEEDDSDSDDSKDEEDDSDTDTPDNTNSNKNDGIDTGDNNETSDDIDTDDDISDIKGTAEITSSPEELLNDYENNILPSEVPYGGFSGTSISYTYGDGSSAAAAITGRVTEIQRDLDGDGIPELLVVEVQSGRIGFRIYKVNNGAVELTASQTISTGMETAIESFSYGSTQACFIMNNNGIYELGLASYCYGYDAGDGTPAVRTYAEVYSVAGDGSISLCASGSVQNGDGQEGFAAGLAPAGMNGSFNSSNAETLQSMGYAEDPYQDVAGAPNPLSGGVNEGGAENLAVIDAEMSAGSGVLTIR